MFQLPRIYHIRALLLFLAAAHAFAPGSERFPNTRIGIVVHDPATVSAPGKHPRRRKPTLLGSKAPSAKGDREKSVDRVNKRRRKVRKGKKKKAGPRLAGKSMEARGKRKQWDRTTKRNTTPRGNYPDIHW